MLKRFDIASYIYTTFQNINGETRVVISKETQKKKKKRG